MGHSFVRREDRSGVRGVYDLEVAPVFVVVLGGGARVRGAGCAHNRRSRWNGRSGAILGAQNGHFSDFVEGGCCGLPALAG